MEAEKGERESGWPQVDVCQMGGQKTCIFRNTAVVVGLTTNCSSALSLSIVLTVVSFFVFSIQDGEKEQRRFRKDCVDFVHFLLSLAHSKRWTRRTRI